MEIQEKLLNIRDFVNNILTTIYDVHDYSIGNIYITDLDKLTPIYIARPGNIPMKYIHDPHREILEIASTGKPYYDDIILDILKLISRVYLEYIVERYYYWYYININNMNDRISELGNYSNEELKLYFKLS